MSQISLSPKGDFLKDAKRAAAHQDVMASPDFQVAARTALLEYQFGLAIENNPAAAAMKIKGAQELLAVLLNLGNPIASRKQFEDEQLKPV